MCSSDLRTAHVAVRGAFPAVDGGPGVDVLDKPLDVFWTRVEVALTGFVAAGDEWTLALDGVNFSHTAATGDTLATVAAALRTKAVAAGAGYTIDLDAARPGTLVISRARSFTARVVKGFDAAAEFTGSIDEAVVQFQLSGPVTIGSVWSLLLGSTTYSHTVTSSSETLATIAASLAAKVGAAATPLRYLDLQAVDLSDPSGLPVYDPIQRRGVQATGYVERGFQLRGYAMRGYAGAGGTIVIDNANPARARLYEDLQGNLSLTDTGKPLFVIDLANSSGLASPLFVDSRGRLTTTDTGVQALQIAQNPAASCA